MRQVQPDALAATFAGLSAAAAVITAAIAGYSLLGSRRDSRDRSRPVVVARMKAAPRGVQVGITYLVVRNVGASVAREVRVTFDPPLPKADDQTDQTNDDLMVLHTLERRYARPLQFLAPGEQLINLLRNMTDPDDPLPETVDVSVAYRDDHGRRYSDTFRLDRETYATGTGTMRGGTDLAKRQTETLEGLTYEIWRGTD